MYLYYFMEEKHLNEFQEVKKTGPNPTGLLPKPNCSAEGLRDYFRFTLETMNTTGSDFSDLDGDMSVLGNKKVLSKRLSEMYKASEVYQEQTPEQRKQAIDLMEKDPLVEETGVYIY